jgi:hypothetical protein
MTLVPRPGQLKVLARVHCKLIRNLGHLLGFKTALIV